MGSGTDADSRRRRRTRRAPLRRLACTDRINPGCSRRRSEAESLKEARYGRAARWLVGTKGEYPFRGTYLPPKAPAGKEKNWLETVSGRGYFAILRLYGPTETAIDKSWKPGDIEKAQ